MLHIQKNPEPQELIDWKRKFKNMHRRKPTYDDFHKTDEKQLVHDKIVVEQGRLCCYCCKRITTDKSHIEHFRPKSWEEYRDLSLDYENLYASCNGEPERKVVHCGHAKQDFFDEKKLISPLEEDCAEHFAFEGNGRIVPKNPEDERAIYTIELLNLNEARLCHARMAAMWAEEGIVAGKPEEREAAIKRYEDRKSAAQIPFADAILYMLREGRASEVRQK